MKPLQPMITAPAPQTLVDALLVSFEASLRSPDGLAKPAALLWTDAEGQWQELIPILRRSLPHLFTLGAYDPQARQGPVIWLKCIVDRTLPEVSLATGTIPVLYLPQVSRQDLRAGGDCKRELQPLIELQYRGTIWRQKNGNDWTLEAFLGSEHGLGLDVARDASTRKAMLRELPRLATEPITALRGRRLEAEDFNRLSVSDPLRDVLIWMSEPAAFKNRCDISRWETFKDVCSNAFHLNVDEGGVEAAADELLNASGKWSHVWKRFCEAPTQYPGIGALLRKAAPRDLLTDRSRQPKVNDEQEEKLRQDLDAVCSLSHIQACDRVLALEEQHRERREWIWAKLDESPYALALEPLASLARWAKTPLGGSSLDMMVSSYVTEAWRCDKAAIDSLRGRGKELKTISQAVRALYGPWLDASARCFQERFSSHPPDSTPQTAGTEPDICIVFVDGLRFDLGMIVLEKLESREFRVRLTHRLAPIPTVTATAKPLASPVHAACVGTEETEDFTPLINERPATKPRLYEAMARMGIRTLDADDVRLRTGDDKGAWMEIGKLDELGHKLGALLVSHIDEEVETIVDCIAGLLNSGWQQVRIVTDHGWLLLPGELPKIELPPSLVATKWTRCAAVRGESTPDVPTYPWYWNERVRIASPWGIAAFLGGSEYSHGGLSLQECVVPELSVERGEQAITARITDASWRGMRCRVHVESNASGLLVDLRLNRKQQETSIVASPKHLGSDGEVSLAVPDDKYESAAASLVVLDEAGQVLDHKATTVGE